MISEDLTYVLDSINLLFGDPNRVALVFRQWDLDPEGLLQVVNSVTGVAVSPPMRPHELKDYLLGFSEGLRWQSSVRGRYSFIKTGSDDYAADKGE